MIMHMFMDNMMYVCLNLITTSQFFYTEHLNVTFDFVILI